jgi:metallo-beta-lactamase class B
MIVTAGQKQSPTCRECSEWNQPQAPFRIFGNSYYVGTHALSSVLITSPSGHVLIDGDLPESVPQIVSHIRSLGFRIEDVKVIVNSHVHFDHAGGIAKLQKLSGARVMASEWSAAVMRRGGVGKDDPQYGSIRPIARIANVHVLHDGDSFTVGGVVMAAHLTAGHTPGGTSWTWRSCEGETCRSMVYADSLSAVSANGFRFTSNREYAGALKDFEKSFAFLETTPCDVLITAHPEMSRLWERLDSRGRGVVPDPMVDSNACRELA